MQMISPQESQIALQQQVHPIEFPPPKKKRKKKSENEAFSQ